jgi:hypothetical protein
VKLGDEDLECSTAYKIKILRYTASDRDALRRNTGMNWAVLSLRASKRRAAISTEHSHEAALVLLGVVILNITRSGFGRVHSLR